jgi:hypothetical protein
LQAENAVIFDANWLPSPPLLITLSNRRYLAELAAKVEAIKSFQATEETTPLSSAA